MVWDEKRPLTLYFGISDFSDKGTEDHVGSSLKDV